MIPSATAFVYVYVFGHAPNNLQQHNIAELLEQE